MKRIASIVTLCVAGLLVACGEQDQQAVQAEWSKVPPGGEEAGLDRLDGRKTLKDHQRRRQPDGHRRRYEEQQRRQKAQRE